MQQTYVGPVVGEKIGGMAVTMHDAARAYVQALVKRSSQRALAAKTGIPRPDINNICAGRRRVTMDQLQRLATGMGLPVTTVLLGVAQIAWRLEAADAVALEGDVTGFADPVTARALDAASESIGAVRALPRRPPKPAPSEEPSSRSDGAPSGPTRSPRR